MNGKRNEEEKNEVKKAAEQEKNVRWNTPATPH
jgi:hypothetical protein